MAEPVLLNTIQKLSKKIDSLIGSHQSLLEKVNELEKINQELRLQHTQDMAKLEKAQKDIEFLSMSHRLATSPQALISARNKISRLIRTIDSCIRTIKED